MLSRKAHIRNGGRTRRGQCRGYKLLTKRSFDHFETMRRARVTALMSLSPLVSTIQDCNAGSQICFGVGDVANGLRIKKSRHRYLPACIRCRAFVCNIVKKCRKTTLKIFSCSLAYRMDLNRGHRVSYPIEASTRLGFMRWFERMNLYHSLQSL